MTAHTPTQQLALCMALLRGGVAVAEPDIVADVKEWVRQHGIPTMEKVDQWADGSELLRRAFERMIAAPVN